MYSGKTTCLVWTPFSVNPSYKLGITLHTLKPVMEGYVGYVCWLCMIIVTLMTSVESIRFFP